MNLPTLPSDYATEVAPGLYVGHARWLDGFEFDSVLTLSSTMPSAPITMRERRYNWSDPALPSRDDLLTLTSYIDLHWGLLGQATLIRDLTGLNRPSLIAGLAMLHHGMTHQQAMDGLTRRSPLALSNGRYRSLFQDTPARAIA